MGRRKKGWQKERRKVDGRLPEGRKVDGRNEGKEGNNLSHPSLGGQLVAAAKAAFPKAPSATPAPKGR